MLEYANLELYWSYPVGVIWKNRQLMNSIQTKRVFFIGQMMFVSKLMW